MRFEFILYQTTFQSTDSFPRLYKWCLQSETCSRACTLEDWVQAHFDVSCECMSAYCKEYHQGDRTKRQNQKKYPQKFNWNLVNSMNATLTRGCIPTSNIFSFYFLLFLLAVFLISILLKMWIFFFFECCKLHLLLKGLKLYKFLKYNRLGESVIKKNLDEIKAFQIFPPF